RGRPRNDGINGNEQAGRASAVAPVEVTADARVVAEEPRFQPLMPRASVASTGTDVSLTDDSERGRAMNCEQPWLRGCHSASRSTWAIASASEWVIVRSESRRFNRAA